MKIPKIVLKFINEDEKYRLKDGFKDTLYWINNITDLVATIFIPGAIALAFFDKSDHLKIIEGLTNYTILCILPTMILFKIIEYRALFFEFLKLLELLYLLLGHILIGLVRCIEKLIKRLWNFFIYNSKI
ncbi:hypothetical protein ACI1TW_09800 [Lactococcus garvieae]|uniref:hypothetical protein n=1 Tax=Lactococcus garvieae TaxID=1363 RepID=UPI003853E052